MSTTIRLIFSLISAFEFSILMPNTYLLSRLSNKKGISTVKFNCPKSSPFAICISVSNRYLSAGKISGIVPSSPTNSPESIRAGIVSLSIPNSTLTSLLLHTDDRYTPKGIRTLLFSTSIL